MFSDYRRNKSICLNSPDLNIPAQCVQVLSHFVTRFSMIMFSCATHLSVTSRKYMEAAKSPMDQHNSHAMFVQTQLFVVQVLLKGMLFILLSDIILLILFCRHLRGHGLNWSSYKDLIDQPKIEHHRPVPLFVENRSVPTLSKDSEHYQVIPLLNSDHRSGLTPTLDRPQSEANPSVFQSEQNRLVPPLSRFSEYRFMNKLRNMSRRKSSIDQIVVECLDHKEEAYKIIRCLKKMIKSVQSEEQKLTIWYLIHNLAMDVSKQKCEEFISRMEMFVLDILPTVIDIISLPTLKKVVSIWHTEAVFGLEILIDLDHIIKSKERENRVTTVESIESKPVMLGLVCPDCRQVFREVTALKFHLKECKERKRKNSWEAEKCDEPRMSVDERLRRDFDIEDED